MNLLFTRSNKLGSRLICAVSGETVSHVAVLFYGEIVAHMSFTGFKLEMLDDFLKSHTVVLRAVVSGKTDVDAAKGVAKFRAAGHGRYDYPAILAFGLLLLWRRSTRDSRPITRNPWQSKRLYMCTEFAAELMGIEDGGVLTPHTLYEKVLQCTSATPST